MRYWFVVVASWGKEYRGDFIAGAIAFLVPLLITSSINGLQDIVAITSLVGLLSVSTILILGFESVFSWLVKWWRKSKFDSLIKIGVLNGYLDEHKTGKLPSNYYTKYNPRDWYDELSSIKGFDVDWAVATEISDNFDIIINPFGETYPEIDKPNLSTLRNIRTFVKNGGIFVNVAGLAFYYVWDGQKEDLSGPLYETYQVTRLPGVLWRIVLPRASHLRDCSLYGFFGVRTTFSSSAILSVTPVSDRFFKGLSSVGGVKDVNEFRSAYRSDKEEATLIPLLKSSQKITVIVEGGKKKQMDFDCYPIAAVKYGKGYLLLNGMALEKSRPEDFQKVLEAIKCVAKKLNSVGFL